MMDKIQNRVHGTLARLLLEVSFVGAAMGDQRSVTSITDALKSARPKRPEPYLANALSLYNAGFDQLSKSEILAARAISPDDQLVRNWERILITAAKTLHSCD
ncbi:MAG: hypothetical protein PW790_11135 [Parvibaculaceae bacterium]|nr:hypothetical protein [Parvibaculaceae bacterium]